MDEHSPFREVWVTLGKLRERLEETTDPVARILGQQLAKDIFKAEKDWKILQRGPGEN